MGAHRGEKSVQDQQLVSDRSRILTRSKLLPFMEWFFMGQPGIHALFISSHQIFRTMKSYILIRQLGLGELLIVYSY